MNTICKEFDLRLQQEKVAGTCQWFQSHYANHDYEDIKAFAEYAQGLSTDQFTPKQHLILNLSLSFQMSITRLQELVTSLHQLDDEDIAELMVHYDLEKPAQRYQEIKAAIAAPTSYLTRIPYKVIRELHERGKVPFDRQIFAACLIRFNVWGRTNYQAKLPSKAQQNFDDFFPKDDFTLDIYMAVFEMELGVEGTFYVEEEFTISAVIIELVNQNYISRTTIQQKLLDAFNNPTMKQNTHGWVKNIYRDLAFTVEENIACQEQLIQLMYNSRNLLVNFGLQQLKKMASHSKFNWTLFINALEGIVYAEKLNGGLKTACKILYKGIKKKPALAEPGCVQLAPIFLQEDNAVQMAATECFELLEVPNEPVKSALLPFVDTMHSEVKQALRNLLGEDTVDATHYAQYVPQHYTPTPCTNEGKLVYIQEEDEFIFLVSRVLTRNDALDYELFLEAILRYRHLKDTHPKALKPALKQAKKIAEDGYLDITARVGVHHIMAAKLICMWLSDTPSTIADEIKRWKEKVRKENRYQYTANRWFGLFSRFGRISYLVDQLQAQNTLPLLSTPTHQQFEIDPTLFFERLAQYQNAKQAPNETDFCIALCRLNRGTAFDKSNLNTKTEYDAILAYLLDEKAVFAPQKIADLDSIWFVAYLLKNPEQSIGKLIQKHHKENWREVAPTWDWDITQKSRDNGYSWALLDLGFEQETIHEIDASQNNYFEHHLSNPEFMIADVSHWFSRDRFLQEPLYLNFILTAYRWNFYNLEASELKSVLEIIKYNAQHPVPLEKVGYLFLAMSLLCSQTTLRAAAFDWLSLLDEHQYLDLEEFTTAVSKIAVSEQHPVPIPRLIEQFDRLAALQETYTDVLHQTVEACLLKVDIDHLPKSFGKVLHHYYEVRQIVDQNIPQNMRLKLEQMQKINSVKKEVKKLLSNP